MSGPRSISSELSTRHVRWALAVAVPLLGLLWVCDGLLFRTPVLTSLEGQAPLRPLFLFFRPEARWSAFLFPLAAAMLILAADKWCDPRRVSTNGFSARLLLAALVLPLMLFWARQPLTHLGALLTYYPGEELYWDGARITELGPFYRHYIENISHLSLHGQHFPPGHATLLYATRLLFGAGPFPIAVVVLILFALGMLFVHRALALPLGPVRSRQGALFCLACPSLIDYAVTSTDAVFFTVAAFALWLSVRALTSPQRPAQAALAGAALFLATLFSYAALSLGLLILLYGLFSGGRPGHRLPRILAALGTMGVSFGACILLLTLATGFSLPDHFLAARAWNRELMTQVAGHDLHELYGRLAYGNGAAFLIGTGGGVVAALLLVLTRPATLRAPFPLAALCVFATLTFGGLHQMETERIWIYTLPWLLWITGRAGPLAPGALRLLLSAGLLQAYVMELLLFSFW